MEEIELIVGDSSNIYEFSSKQVGSLDINWVGSWNISESVDTSPILSGNLVKNENIYNEDSLVNEDIRTTFKIFEPNSKEIVVFNETSLSSSYAVVSGRIYTEGKDTEGNNIEIPETDKYITLTIKGVFVPFSRTQRVKTDLNGNFTYSFNIDKTVKTPLESFFIFQLLPLQSEQLEVKTYILSVEVRQNDSNGEPLFRREVLHAKLKMVTQRVL